MPDFKQQELRVLIDLYPADVLQIIVSKAGVSNLTKILSSKEFLKQNKNLKYAIDETIVKNKYTFNNESMKPDKMIYWNPPRKRIAQISTEQESLRHSMTIAWLSPLSWK